LRGQFKEHDRSNLVKALTPIFAEIEQDKSREDRSRIEVGSAKQYECCQSVFHDNQFGSAVREY